MIPNEHIEESLSISYVFAVVAKAGQIFNLRARDYGVDGSVNEIRKIDNDFIDCGATFDCQLKATINWKTDIDGNILYDMRAEAYNRLIKRNSYGTIPCYLILFCLPDESDNWLSINHDELILRKCCFFYYLKGTETTNSSSKRIIIPYSNIFNCNNINKLIQNPFGDIDDQ